MQSNKKIGYEFKIGEEVMYCGHKAVITDQQWKKSYGHQQHTYHVRYDNDFSSLPSSAKFIREDVLKKIK